MTQIHLNVPEDFWKRLYAGTDQWPGSRSDASICRYALHELYVDLRSGDVPIPADGPRGGPRHLQVKAKDQETQQKWDFLAAQYGSYSHALRIALQHLLDSLEASDE